MKDKKYYTPSIEEFHIGFEYQRNNASTRPKEEQEWIDSVASGLQIEGAEYDMSGTCPKNEREARANGYRVKYLDRSDIESLGFKINSPNGAHNTGGSDINEAFVITALERKDDANIEHTHFLYFNFLYEIPKIHITRKIEYRNNETIFKGTIKNKSELKKLLKQLGI